MSGWLALSGLARAGDWRQGIARALRGGRSGSWSPALGLAVDRLIGEGGSGGAIAIATGNRIYMLEHAIYSVISPEGAASILWRDATRAKDAAANMKITAQDLKTLGVIDEIIEGDLELAISRLHSNVV